MIIKEELLKEHSLQNTMKIVAFAIQSDQNLEELIHCFVSNEYRLAQRAAWVVSHVASKSPELINRYLPELVKQLKNKEVHIAVVRNAMRILQQIEIPALYHAEVMNACFSFIEDSKTAVAVKAFSLTTLDNLSRYYPEIRHELQLIIEERWNIESAAFRSRAKRILFPKHRSST